MMQRYKLWVSALAAAALVACGDDNTGGSPVMGAGVSGGGIGGAPTTAGIGGAAPGTSGTAAPAAGASGAGRGTAGMASGGTGGPIAGAPMPQAGTMGPAGTGGAPVVAGTGGTGVAGSSAGTGGAAPPAMGSCGPDTMVSAAQLGDPKSPGPWTPMHVERTGPTGASWIYYPEGLGKDGMKHPVFQWGPGAGTGPSNYLDHLNLLASHGFVIISQPSTNSGKQALDWILAENGKQGSMWYQKLDPDRVGRGGHSMGALQSFSESADPRLKFAILVCGGANGGSGAAKMSYPTLFLGGKGESGTTNFKGDFAEVTGLSVFVTHSMTDHIYCARDNLGPWVAFMRWQFCGEEAKWKKEFMPGGTYCSGEWLDCMTKNF